MPEKHYRSNSERFWAGMAQVKPATVPGSNRWDIGSLVNWKQLFTVGKLRLLSQPALGIALDGGTQQVFGLVKGLFYETLPEELKVHYRWVPATDVGYQVLERAIEPNNLELQSTWPKCGVFQIVPSSSVALPAFWYDIVFLLPPADVDVREKYLHIYLEASWILVVWEDQLEEQRQLIELLISMITREVEHKCWVPWLFVRRSNGQLELVLPIQGELLPLPENVRLELLTIRE